MLEDLPQANLPCRFPAKPENGKPHQEQSRICATAARRLSAGRLQKRAENGSFRQMAA